ncbi:MAG: hypothetical protein QXY40_07575 [Candidatus Methanomethylicia archaeon]
MNLKGKLILVAGGGYFGSIAVKSLKSMEAKIIVVDVNESCKASKYVDKVINTYTIANPNEGEAYLVVYDCVKYLTEMVRSDIVPDIIVPAIPGHFIGRFIKSYLEAEGFNIDPDPSSMNMVLKSNILNNVALDINAEDSVIVASYMLKGLKCRIPCIQPEICPVTDRIKKIPMYLLLELAIDNISYPRIFQSHLISSDIGGIQGESISILLDEIISSNKLKVAIGTACKCHGIVNFFKILKQNQAKL